MIHAVHLSNAQVGTKGVLKEVRRYPQGIRIEGPAGCGVAPEGYMSGEEFRARAIKKVNHFCDHHGIL